MALYRRGRVWYADFYANGKRVQESTGANTPSRSKSRFPSLASGISSMRRPTSDRGSGMNRFMVHLNAALEPMQLADIGPFPIERYKIERVKVASPATVNREIALLKHMFNLAEQWGLFRGRNPMKGIKFLSENNLAIPVGYGIRGIDVAPVLLAISAGPCSFRDQHQIPASGKGEYVFYNPETGGQWKDLWLGLKKACRKGGLNDVTWHTFRHTFASRLTRAGADLVTVKEPLGHSTISVTMGYAHTNRDAKTRAVRLLD